MHTWKSDNYATIGFLNINLNLLNYDKYGRNNALSSFMHCYYVPVEKSQNNSNKNGITKIA